MQTLTSDSPTAQMSQGERADGRKRSQVYNEVGRRESVRLSQIVPCLFLEWRDRPSCHLLSLDWFCGPPVAEALHTKLSLISGPCGLLALEF